MTVVYILVTVASIGAAVWFFLTKLGAVQRDKEAYAAMVKLMHKTNAKLRNELVTAQKTRNEQQDADNSKDLADNNTAGIADRLSKTVGRR